jgi:hypothetical protein
MPTLTSVGLWDISRVFGAVSRAAVGTFNIYTNVTG